MITSSVILPSVIVPNVVPPVSRIIPDLGVYHNQHLSFLFLFKLVKQDDLLNIKAHTVNSFESFRRKQLVERHLANRHLANSMF